MNDILTTTTTATAALLLTIVITSHQPTQSFTTPLLQLKQHTGIQQRTLSPSCPPLSNFFSKILQDAFANDSNLSSDKSQDQLEYDDGSSTPTAQPLTQVQKEWYSAMQKSQKRTKFGAPINAELLRNTRWVLRLYLAGVPDRDPSNNLYGSRVNISSRDRDLDLGVSVPKEPSVEVGIEFLEGGVCRIDKSPFTTSESGSYILSPDNQYLRLSLPSTGYQRTVTTTGTIQKIYWSNDNERTTKTSSTYSIPEGPVYAEVKMGYGVPGELVMSEGVLRFEKKVGLVGSKLVNCGKVEGMMIMEGVAGVGKGVV